MKLKSLPRNTKLGYSSHGSIDERQLELCVMEAVAYVAGEKHSDRPICADPFLTTLMISINDEMGSDEIGDDARAKYLKRFVRRLVGTKTTKQETINRQYQLLDWYFREFIPEMLKPFEKKLHLVEKFTNLPIFNKNSKKKFVEAVHKIACELDPDDIPWHLRSPSKVRLTQSLKFKVDCAAIQPFTYLYELFEFADSNECDEIKNLFNGDIYDPLCSLIETILANPRNVRKAVRMIYGKCGILHQLTTNDVCNPICTVTVSA